MCQGPPLAGYPLYFSGFTARICTDVLSSAHAGRLDVERNARNPILLFFFCGGMRMPSPTGAEYGIS